ncbi:MAG: DUF6279 family lipoprotein [Aquabacterium sp.]
MGLLTPFSVRAKRWIILALLPLLASCSALRLAYSTAPEITYWWADRYVDFSAEQAPRARAALSDWFAWHRSSQIPDYVAFLASVRAQALGAVTAAQVCQRSAEINQRLDVAFDRALPALADIALTLTPANLEHMAERYRKGNAEFRDEYAQGDPRKRREASFERTLKRMEDWYGRLDEAQRKDLAAAMATSPFDATIWLAERDARQQDILRTLRAQLAARADKPRMAAALRQLADSQAQSSRPAAREYQQRLVDYNCAMVARIHNSTTAAQRQRLAEKLRGYEDDLRAIGGLAPSDS